MPGSMAGWPVCVNYIVTTSVGRRTRSQAGKLDGHGGMVLECRS